MRRMPRAGMVAPTVLSTVVVTMTIIAAPASASDKSSGKHQKTETVTSAKVCSLLTPAEGAALLGKSGQTATPVAQKSTRGNGDCTWGTADGSNVDVNVTHISSPVHGCNDGGQSVSTSGWKGCYYSSEPSFTASKGQTYLDITFNVLPGSNVSKSAIESDVTQIFKGLGA